MQRPDRQSLTTSWIEAWSASLEIQLELLQKELLAVQECLIILSDIVLCVKVAIAECEESSGSSLALDNVDTLGPELNARSEMVGVVHPVLGFNVHAVMVTTRVSVAIQVDALQVGSRQKSVKYGRKGLLPHREYVALPTAQNDAQQQETVVGTDVEEELLESNGMLEFQGLSVENGNGLLIDGLADTQDGWSEVCDFLVISLVDGLQQHLSSTGTLLLFVEKTTSNHLFLYQALGEESKWVGLLFKKEFVDHNADLKRELHQTKGTVLQRLLGLLDCTLGLGPCGLCIIRSIMVRSCCIEVLFTWEGTAGLTAATLWMAGTCGKTWF